MRYRKTRGAEQRMSAGGVCDGEVEDFLRGDPAALAAVYEAVRFAVRGFEFPDPALDRELTQEALTRIFLNLSSGQFRGEASLQTYAAWVARYTCLGYLRQRRLEIELDAESVPSLERWSHPEESFLSSEEHLKNLEAFAKLPLDGRELLRMIFVDRFSYREVALKLGISVGAVK